MKKFWNVILMILLALVVFFFFMGRKHTSDAVGAQIEALKIRDEAIKWQKEAERQGQTANDLSTELAIITSELKECEDEL